MMNAAFALYRRSALLTRVGVTEKSASTSTAGKPAQKHVKCGHNMKIVAVLAALAVLSFTIAYCVPHGARGAFAWEWWNKTYRDRGK